MPSNYWPLLFTAVTSVLPSLFRGDGLCTEWLEDWDDGVNYYRNPSMIRAWSAGSQWDLKALLSVVWGVWLPVEGAGVVLGVYEPVATTAKLVVTAFAAATSTTTIVAASTATSQSLTTPLSTSPSSSLPLDPRWLTCTSLALHCLAAVLLQRCCALLLAHVRLVGKAHLRQLPQREAAQKQTTLAGPAANEDRGEVLAEEWGSALAASLWAAHPMRTEVVGWLSCLPYSLSGVFALASVRFFILGKTGEMRRRLLTPSHEIRTHSPGPQGSYFCSPWLGVRLSYACASLCKAPALTLPLALLVLDLVLSSPQPKSPQQQLPALSPPSSSSSSSSSPSSPSSPSLPSNQKREATAATAANPTTATATPAPETAAAASAAPTSLYLGVLVRCLARHADLLALMLAFAAFSARANHGGSEKDDDHISASGGGGGGGDGNDEAASSWEAVHKGQYLWARGDYISKGKHAWLVQAFKAAHSLNSYTFGANLWPRDLAMIYPIPLNGWPLPSSVVATTAATPPPPSSAFSLAIATNASLSAVAWVCLSVSVFLACLWASLFAGHRLMLLRARKRAPPAPPSTSSSCVATVSFVGGGGSAVSAAVVGFGAAWAGAAALLLPTLGFVQHGWPVLRADRYFHLGSLAWPLLLAFPLRDAAARLFLKQKRTLPHPSSRTQQQQQQQQQQQLEPQPEPQPVACSDDDRRNKRQPLDVAAVADLRKRQLQLQLTHRARAAVGCSALLVLCLSVQSAWELRKWRSSTNLWSHAALSGGGGPADCSAAYNLACALEKQVSAGLLPYRRHSSSSSSSHSSSSSSGHSSSSSSHSSSSLNNQKHPLQATNSEAPGVGAVGAAAAGGGGGGETNSSSSAFSVISARAMSATAAAVAQAVGWGEAPFSRVFSDASSALEGVEKLFALACERDPNYGAAWNNRGQIAEKRGSGERAEGFYRRAVELSPVTHYKAHNNLAQLLHRRGAYDDAEVGYRTALKIFPSYHVALFNLATLLHTTGQGGRVPVTERREEQPPPQQPLSSAPVFNPFPGGAMEEALALYRRAVAASSSDAVPAVSPSSSSPTSPPSAPLSPHSPPAAAAAAGFRFGMPEAHYNLAVLLLNLRGGNSGAEGVEALSEALAHLEASATLRPHHRPSHDMAGHVRSVLENKKNKNKNW